MGKQSQFKAEQQRRRGEEKTRHRKQERRQRRPGEETYPTEEEAKRATREFIDLKKAVQLGKIEVIAPGAPQEAPVRIAFDPETQATAPAAKKGEPEVPRKAARQNRRPNWQIWRDDFQLRQEAHAFNARNKLPWADLKAMLRGKAEGRYPLPLGFIPDPLLVLGFRPMNGDVQYQIVDATPEVVAQYGLEIPTPWKAIGEIPDWLRQAIDVQLTIIEGIGGEPTPFHLGLVGQCRRDRKLPKVLRLGFSQYRYEGQDYRFGVCLIPDPETGGMLIRRIWNPDNLPVAPAEGKILTPKNLNDQGPVQKIINAWIRLEDNSSWYRDNPNRPFPSQPSR